MGQQHDRMAPFGNRSIFPHMHPDKDRVLAEYERFTPASAGYQIAPSINASRCAVSRAILANPGASSPNAVALNAINTAKMARHFMTGTSLVRSQANGYYAELSGAASSIRF